MPIIIAILILVLTATVVNGQDAASPSPLPVNPVCDWAFSQAVQRAQVSPAPALPTPTPGPSASPGPSDGGLLDGGFVDRAFLDDAVRLCAGVEDWEAAAALHPEALGATDPLEFLAERCADPTAGLEVYSTCVSLTRALATPPPTPVPTPMPSLSPAPSSSAGQSAWTPEARATSPRVPAAEPAPVSRHPPEPAAQVQHRATASVRGQRRDTCCGAPPGRGVPDRCQAGRACPSALPDTGSGPALLSRCVCRRSGAGPALTRHAPFRPTGRLGWPQEGVRAVRPAAEQLLRRLPLGLRPARAVLVSVGDDREVRVTLTDFRVQYDDGPPSCPTSPCPVLSPCPVVEA